MEGATPFVACTRACELYILGNDIHHSEASLYLLDGITLSCGGHSCLIIRDKNFG